MYCLFVFNGIELLDHLRQSPGSQRSKDHYTKQIGWIRSQKGSVRSRHNGAWHLCQFLDRRHKSTVSAEYGCDHRYDTKQHDDSLDQVIPCSSHISAYDHIHTCQHRHYYHADPEIYIKCHTEQVGKSVVY